MFGIESVIAIREADLARRAKISDENFRLEMDSLLKKQNVCKKERNRMIGFFLQRPIDLRDSLLEDARKMIEVPAALKSEDEEQIEFVYKFRKLYPDAILYCVRNDGSRTPSEKNKQVLMGVLAGVSDLVCPTYRMYIEMKRAKGGVQSEAQKAFEQKALKEGWHYILGLGCDDALKKVARIINDGTVLQK